MQFRASKLSLQKLRRPNTQIYHMTQEDRNPLCKLNTIVINIDTIYESSTVLESGTVSTVIGA